jgi:hypothetical protein
VRVSQGVYRAIAWQWVDMSQYLSIPNISKLKLNQDSLSSCNIFIVIYPLPSRTTLSKPINKFTLNFWVEKFRRVGV